MSNGRIGPPWWLMGRGTGGSRTVSGPVAHWKDKVVAPLRALRVGIDPVQDLHGYDSPWPAGGGKNLYNKDGHDYSNGYIATEYLKSDGTQTQPTAGNWQTSEYIPIAGGLYYTISGLSTSDSHSPAMCYYDSSKSFISGMPYQNRAQITHQSPSNAAYVRLSIGPTATTQDSVQFEQSASKTPYAPYSNICPISGWSAVNVWVKPTYDPTANPTATIQLGQTVYGGTLDVTNGVLTVDRAMVDLGTLSWSVTASGSFGTRLNDGKVFPSVGQNPNDYECSIYLVERPGSSGSYQAEDYIIWHGTGTYCYVYVRDSRYADAATFTTAMSGVRLVYELATPITIPLTPTEISTLQGQNNVWADSGDVTVTYLSGEGNPALVALALAHRIEE